MTDDLPPGSLGLRLTNPPEVEPGPTNIFQRWNLAIDDPDAQRVAGEVASVWDRWIPSQRLMLLHAAEAVARAEAARQQWNPKGIAERYKAVALSGIQAARLVKTLATQFPPPWDREHDSIRVLVGQLMDFVACAVNESSVADPDVPIRLARATVRSYRANTPQHADKVSWRLLEQLAWLASGKQIHRRNIWAMRRYLDEHSLMPSPAAPEWKRTWEELLKEVALTVGPALSETVRSPESFQAAIKNRLGV